MCRFSTLPVEGIQTMFGWIGPNARRHFVVAQVQHCCGYLKLSAGDCAWYYVSCFVRTAEQLQSGAAHRALYDARE
jgi:hypothetical protein